MNSYLGLAVACPDYFTHKTPAPSAKVTEPVKDANLARRPAEAALAPNGTNVAALPSEA